MTAEDQSIIELDALAAPSADDVIPIVDDPGGSPVIKKITIANFLAGYVAKALFNANTILAANADDTPAAVTIEVQQVLGRITAGNIKGLSVAELLTLLGIAYGTWIPTLFNTTNVAASTAYSSSYCKIGTIVMFGGRIAIDVTAAAATELGIELPIASAFATARELGGTASNINSESAELLADYTNDRILMRFNAVTLTNIGWGFHGIYQIV